MIRHASEETARRAAHHWAPGAIIPLGVSGSAAWRLDGPAGGLVLRLVDPAHRSREQTESELAFMRHLAAAGDPVVEPVAARDGSWTALVDGFVASVVTWARGDDVAEGGPAFDRAWGRALATLHEAALDYAGPARWEWHEEPWLAEADRLLPADDATSRAEWVRLRAALERLPRTPQGYGTIHGDHGPQNFRYDRATGRIITFDFGNACRHWFAMDVTVALSTLRRDPARDRRRADLLAGYRSVRPLEAASWAAWRELLQLRILYVYLSRLDAFGPAPDASRRATLQSLRALVAERVEWPLDAAAEESIA
jgi:Ser/Thr protein kinase RdoA (MazF antagonist)